MKDKILATKLILASNSPRRSELLALGGWTFQVQAADIDESIQVDESPQEYVLRLARTKAHAVAGDLGAAEADAVVAADTTVVEGGVVLGKPRHAAEAAAMLKQLRGHTHQVFTAVAVVRTVDRAAFEDLCETPVPMRSYTDEEIDDYVSSGDPLDKAGAYAIQNLQFRPVLVLSGCFASVMGLPLCHLTRLLQKAGLPCPVAVPKACQDHLSYTCDTYPEILGLDSQAGGEDLG